MITIVLFGLVLILATALCVVSHERDVAQLETQRIRNFGFSRCVHCGIPMPSGQVRRCKRQHDEWCTWHIPQALNNHINGSEE